MLGRKFAKESSAGASVAPALGTRERYALLDAIFASGMTVHAAEINDFCPSAFTQPGASVIPATLCLGDVRNVSGEAFMRAMIVGYEISCRLPKALGVQNMRRGVLANHCVGPLFGSAAAVASLIRLPRERMVDVFSYCVQQAGGSWHWLRDIEHIEKAFDFGGMPARRGAECALMVEAGFTGIGDPFQGDPGWLNSTLFTREGSDFNPAYMTEKLGERFEFPLIAYKRYPVGGPTQPVIELMLGFIKDLPRERVRHVRIEMPGRTGAFASAEMPALNLPYLCSIILADGRLDFVAAQSRERFLTDRKIRAFMPNVAVIHDPKQEAEPRIESARVILTLDDGSKHERFLDHVKGFPAHPFERKDVEEKAIELIAPNLGAERAREIVNTIWRLERVENVRQIVGMIAR
jgi:2-methylcitrate dehydratase PrpD